VSEVGLMVRIPAKDLKAAAVHLRDAIVMQKVRVSHVRLKQQDGGIFASARINGQPVETNLPRGVCEWKAIADKLIRAATDTRPAPELVM